MAQIYFHCSTAERVLIDRSGARGWVLQVSDDCGDEILIVPFASVLGKPH